MDQLAIKAVPFTGRGVELLELFAQEPNLFLLESSLDFESLGRYSFLGFAPFQVLELNGADSLTQLKKEYERFQNFSPSAQTPLSGGIVGFLAYDLGLSLENIAVKVKNDLPIPHCYFGFYDTILTIDHFTQTLYISSTGLPETSSHLRKFKIQERVNYVMNVLSEYHSRPMPALDEKGPEDVQSIEPHLISNMSQDEYVTAVKKALDYIRQGEIYQVNLAQQFCLDTSPLGGSPDTVRLYQQLRRLSPSCFGGYLGARNFQIISSSPERFIHLNDGVLQTRPMKGTRSRGINPADDQRQKQELLQSDKDRAELLMITDLERNDLGRVCEFGSVEVGQMRVIEEYETVFQATSTVKGLLAKDKDAFDALAACFPGGSITGCPKIRSMQIIEELEPTHRSVYTGALGYISFDGRMDFNILIRTLLSHQNKIYFHVGSGIVADSSPLNEYQETLVKAKALKACLKTLVPSKKVSHV